MIIDTKRYHNYIDSCAKVLGLNNYNGVLDFVFMKKLDQDASGYCWDNDDGDANIEIATHVQGEPLDEITILQNIAHEMIHAQQIASGRMKDLGVLIVPAGDCETLVHVVEFDGEFYKNVPYDDQPWEKEAYAEEQRIFEEACKMLPLKEYEKLYG